MASSKIPAWVIACLDQYANCACGRNLVMKLGVDQLLDILAKDGYPCELEILSDQKDVEEFPKDGTYILTLKNRKELDLEDLEGE
ncbi:MAG: hypothetical protein HUJ54_06295 [Erysipelotrichaceae bacterium]|nr:hypothetical protein [Erysipelotrichaceae bacterium]